jgi:hypothetical protein
MDHVRIVDQELVFGPKRPEFNLAFPLDAKQYLIDANLSIVTRPGSNFSGAGADNVRLYCDGIDFTPSYLAELQAVVDSWDQDLAEDAYRDALKRWLRFAVALGTDGYGSDVQAEVAHATQLAAKRPLSSLVTKIGDTHHGWSGHLHLINFIDQFGLPIGVSLAKVLTRHNAGGGTPIRTLDIKCLTVSSGRSATWDTQFDPAVDLARGAVSLRFELRYHDPLEDEVNELKRQLGELRDVIDKRLELILQAVSPGGQIQRRLTGVEQQVRQAHALSEKATRDLSSQDAHLSALENTLREIRTLVQQL